MATLLFFVFLYLICKGIKSGIRSARNAERTKPTTATVNPVSRNLATLEALQSQRDELNEQLEIINAALDGAPPEAQRMKWLKERSRVYGQLATVENKITKLVG